MAGANALAIFWSPTRLPIKVAKLFPAKLMTMQQSRLIKNIYGSLWLRLTKKYEILTRTLGKITV